MKEHPLAKKPMTAVAAPRSRRDPGFMKSMVDADTNQILGAAISGSKVEKLCRPSKTQCWENLPYTALRTDFRPPHADGILKTVHWAMDSGK